MQLGTAQPQRVCIILHFAFFVICRNLCIFLIWRSSSKMANHNWTEGINSPFWIGYDLTMAGLQSWASSPYTDRIESLFMISSNTTYGVHLTLGFRKVALNSGAIAVAIAVNPAQVSTTVGWIWFWNKRDIEILKCIRLYLYLTAGSRNPFLPLSLNSNPKEYFIPEFS